MGIDFQAFAKGFLDRSQIIMDENSEEAKEYEKRQRELADRNVGVIGKRRSTATAVLSAAKGLSNLGVSKDVIKLAISTPGGLAKLQTEINKARADLGKDWNPKLIESFVNLPEEFKNSDALQNDGVSLKDFVYNTHGLTTPTLGPSVDEVAVSGGKFGMFDNFFNKNAMEDARTKLSNEMIYGDMSVAEINKLSKQDEYSSQIEGAYLNYNYPKYISAEASGTIRKELELQKDDWRSSNLAGLTELAKARARYVDTIGSTIASNKNENLKILADQRRDYLTRREELTNSLRLRLETITGPAIQTYDEDQFNTKIGGYYKEILKIDTLPDATIDTSSKDLTTTDSVVKSISEQVNEKFKGFQVSPYATQFQWEIIEELDIGTFKTEIYVNDETGLMTVISRDQYGEVSATYEDTDNNPVATNYAQNNGFDIRNTLAEVTTSQTKKETVPVISPILSSTKTSLGDMGFKLNIGPVPASSADPNQSVWNKLNRSLGNIYDRKTGKINERRFEVFLKKQFPEIKKMESKERDALIASLLSDVSASTEVAGPPTASGTVVNDDVRNRMRNPDALINNVIDEDEVITSADAPEVTSDFNLDGLGGSPNTKTPIIKTADESITTDIKNPGLMTKPELGTPFIAPDSPEEPDPGKPINLRELKKKQDAQKDLSKLPPRSEFMVEFGDEILEALLDRKNITVKNVEAGRLGQLNNVLTAWERKNKGKKISTKDKKAIIKEYIESKGK